MLQLEKEGGGEAEDRLGTNWAGGQCMLNWQDWGRQSTDGGWPRIPVGKSDKSLNYPEILTPGPEKALVRGSPGIQRVPGRGIATPWRKLSNPRASSRPVCSVVSFFFLISSTPWAWLKSYHWTEGSSSQMVPRRLSRVLLQTQWKDYVLQHGLTLVWISALHLMNHIGPWAN